MNKQTYLILLLFFMLGHLLLAQNPHPHFINYTTDDGLPDLVVYQAMQDSKGYMWFATDNGVCRFNGYEFERFPTTSQINYASVFDFQEDGLGRIWFNSLKGEIYFIENDSIHGYWNNHVINSYKGRFQTAANFYVKNNGEKVFVELGSQGILEVQESGTDSFHTCPTTGGVWAMEVASDKIMSRKINKQGNRERLDYLVGKGIQEPLYIHEKDTVYVIENLPNLKGRRFSRIAVLKIKEDGYLYFNQNLLVYIKEGKPVWQIPYGDEVIEMIQGKDGSFHFCLLGGKGIRRYDDMEAIRNNRFTALLKGITVTWMCEDSEGGVWYTTYGQGVFYTPDPNLLIYDQESRLSADLIRSISIENEGSVFIGLQNGDVYRVATSTGQPVLLHEKQTSDFLYFVLYDCLRQNLWIGKSGGPEALNLNTGKSYSPPAFKNKGNSITRYGSISSDNKTLWGFSHIDIGKLDLDLMKFTSGANDYGYKVRAYSLLEDSNRNIWIGTKEGLMQWRDSVAIVPANRPDELSGYITCMVELPDSTFAIGTRGQGLVFWKSDSVQVLYTTNEMLGNDAFRKLHLEEDGTIWAVTEPGLKTIRRQTDGTFDIKNFTTADGLPTNVVWDVATTKKYVWVATNKGLVRMPRKDNVPTSPKPKLNPLLVNGTPVPINGDLELGHDENSLTFRFNTMKFRQLGHIDYRYRLLPSAETWTETKTLRADYPSLPAGEFMFELQSKNEDGEWSGTTAFSFEIKPPWWQRWWFYLLALGVSVAAFYVFYKYRTGILKKEIALQSQVTDLEKKALQAQMNPHFIFNCLTSIQKLIFEKDANNAMRYLVRFSKLVRGMLDASVAGEVNLQEEIGLLKNYLELEKLRFGDAFGYEIKIDPGLGFSNITFSPMLLQPYVENAVVHGMQQKEKGGMVIILFDKKDESIFATITDNGPGITQTSKLNTNHKSVGMSITRRRLELMHQVLGEDGLVQADEVFDEKGLVAGTRVQVRLK